MIRLAVDPFPAAADLDSLFLAAWGQAPHDYAAKILPRSLVHVGAFSAQNLIGFVNVAWDGGVHAFLVDTTVHPDFRRQSIATQMVRRATAEAATRGADWLHVDFEPHLESFYRGCGFRPTAAGLIRLR